MGAIDYWCNAFEPDRRALWEASIAAQGLSIRIRDGEDDFAEPEQMVARMDRIGVDALILPVAGAVESDDPTVFERFCTHTASFGALARKWPGRFAALWSIDPTEGLAGVREAAAMLDEDGFVGLLIHTHSWDRRFDDRDYYPYYALAAERDAAVVVQAGSSGGLMPSECGRPIGIDRPALYFGDVPFVLSHAGWPWVDEAVAMASKHPNVYIGTASHPPHRWPERLLEFVRGAGRSKVLWGTSYPTVGHSGSLERIDAIDLDDATRRSLLEGAARAVFARLPATR